MELKSCPFCGSENVSVSDRIHYGQGDCTCSVFVECKDCKCRGGDIGDYGKPTSKMKEQAVELWNKRKE